MSKKLNKLAWTLTTVGALLIASNTYAEVTVNEPWVRATVANQPSTGAFMELLSDQDSSLIKADSPIAKHVEVHEMHMDNDIMKMREIPRIELPKGEAVKLEPGSYHIMLIDLKKQVKEGEHVPLELTFEYADGKQETIHIEAHVQPLASNSQSHNHDNHKH